MSAKEMTINGRNIGPKYTPYIIAELSGNHNGELERALALLDAAKSAGADAIKLQTYTPDTMTIKCDKPDFKVTDGLWNGYTLHDLYQWAHTPWEWHPALFERAKELDITLFSTPFDETAVDFLEALNCPAYKIASFEATDLPLIKRVAQTGKPLIISTGLANFQEIEDIVNTVRQETDNPFCLLHCVSSYPAPADQSHVRTVPDLAKKFNTISGLSDHSLGNTVAITAIAQGACVIEKHVTLKRADGGPDAAFSLEPNELAALCQESKAAWLALGYANYERKPAEEKNLVFRRSIYVTEDIKAGEKLTVENTRRIRPGYGLSPKHYEKVLGKSALADIERGTPLSWEHLEND